MQRLPVLLVGGAVTQRRTILGATILAELEDYVLEDGVAFQQLGLAHAHVGFHFLVALFGFGQLPLDSLVVLVG